MRWLRQSLRSRLPFQTYSSHKAHTSKRQPEFQGQALAADQEGSSRSVLRKMSPLSFDKPHRVGTLRAAVFDMDCLTLCLELRTGELVKDEFFTLFESVGALEVRILAEVRLKSATKG